MVDSLIHSNNQETGKTVELEDNTNTLKQKRQHIKEGAKKFGQKVLAFPGEHPIATLLTIIGLTALETKVFGSENMENLMGQFTERENGVEDKSNSNVGEKNDMEHRIWARRLADINEGMYEERSNIYDAQVEKNYAAAMLGKAREKENPQLISYWEAEYEKRESIFKAHNDEYEGMKQRLAEHYAIEPKRD